MPKTKTCLLHRRRFNEKQQSSTIIIHSGARLSSPWSSPTRHPGAPPRPSSAGSSSPCTRASPLPPFPWPGSAPQSSSATSGQASTTTTMKRTTMADRWWCEKLATRTRRTKQRHIWRRFKTSGKKKKTFVRTISNQSIPVKKKEQNKKGLGTRLNQLK